MQTLVGATGVELAGGVVHPVVGPLLTIGVSLLGEPTPCLRFVDDQGVERVVPRASVTALIGATFVDPEAEARAKFSAEQAERQRRERESGLEPTSLRAGWRIVWRPMAPGTATSEAITRLRAALDREYVDPGAVVSALSSFGSAENGQLRGWDRLRADEIGSTALANMASSVGRKVLAAATARAAAA